MNFFIQLAIFSTCCAVIVLVSKYMLVKALRVFGESLNLNPKIVGSITGFATSVPELLTVTVSSAMGLMGTSVYNILTSNIINLIQYIASVFINKNEKFFRKKALKVDVILVLLTIFIPYFIMIFNITLNTFIIPVLFVLFFGFYFISYQMHKHFLIKDEEQLNEKILEEEQQLENKGVNAILSALVILASGGCLYFVCTILKSTLENLTSYFGIPEVVLGIVFGFVTSIPELITFFESQRYYIKKDNSELGMVEVTSNLLMSNIMNLFFILPIGILLFTIFK